MLRRHLLMPSAPSVTVMLSATTGVPKTQTLQCGLQYDITKQTSIRNKNGHTAIVFYYFSNAIYACFVSNNILLQAKRHTICFHDGPIWWNPPAYQCICSLWQLPAVFLKLQALVTFAVVLQYMLFLLFPSAWDLLINFTYHRPLPGE